MVVPPVELGNHGGGPVVSVDDVRLAAGLQQEFERDLCFQTIIDRSERRRDRIGRRKENKPQG
jgi:hypothetical protein